MKQNIFLALSVLILLSVGCNKTTSDALLDNNVDITEASSEEIQAKIEKSKHIWRSNPPAPAPARSISIGDYSSFDLDNGLKVIVVENHKLPRVSYQLSLINNPIQEKDQAGFVSIAGQLLKTGTKSKSKAEIDASIDFIGANINTYGRGAFGSSLKKHQDKLLSLMTEILYEPSFDQAEFDKIKTQTLSGLSTTKTDPNAMAENVANVLTYGKDHPYGEVENEATVTNITLDECKKYYDTYFKPNNAYLVVVGDITPDEAKTTVEKYFGAWKSKDVPTHNYKVPTSPEGAKVSFVNKDAAVQSVIRITYPVDLTTGDDGIMAAMVMNNILGGGIFSGRLMQNLREDKAFTYGARSNLSPDRLVGNFNAYASVRNEVTDSSVQEFLFELNRLRDEPISAEDLSLVKNSMSGSFARSLESPQTIARFARNTFRYNLPQDYYNTYLERLESVTIEDVQAAAQKFIQPDNAYIVVAGSKDDVAEKLVRFDSDGIIDYYDAFGNKVELNDNPIPEGISAETVITDYINAIGGKEALMKVNTMQQTASMELMGQTASIDMKQKDNKMFALKISMSGMTVQEQVFDGSKLKMGGMQGTQVLTEGDEYDAMKYEALIFPQMSYMNEGYKLDLKGIESIDGKSVYKLVVTNPNGDLETEYYDQQSSLLLRSIATQEAQGQTMSVTSDYSDYKEVSGIKIPYTVTVSGAMPMPMVMKSSEVKINADIPTDSFSID